jgi:hypothetical protein
MKKAFFTAFVLVCSSTVLASGAQSEAGYVNYTYSDTGSGVPFNLLRTGSMVEPGIYEPGYVNYRYLPSDPGPETARTGKWLSSGVFEPTYLNYCVDSV